MIGEQVKVLGLNCAHDAAACVLVDGELAVAIAEERLNRRKHFSGYPHLAVGYCLELLDYSDISVFDCIVINENPHTNYSEAVIKPVYSGPLFRNPSHHLLHAYYAWASSGFNDSAILIVDGSGYSYGEHKRQNSPLLGDVPPVYSEMEEAESLYIAKNGRIDVVEKCWGLWHSGEPFYRFPSLGHMFSMASQYIFGDWIHAGKTMGLAPYGRHTAIREEIITCDDAGISVDTSWIMNLPPRSDRPAHLDNLCCDVAAKVQFELERAMLFLSERLYKRTGMSRLCISGGVALNCITNSKILDQGLYSEVFVTPAASDSGVAIGAALYGHQIINRKLPKWTCSTDFHGRIYEDKEIESALLEKPHLEWELVENAAQMAAQDISSGRIIAWYEGRSEFGPRALGHRSILCDPRDSHIRDRLNEIVKFREPFRPYAASVLSTRQVDFFEIKCKSPFMLFACSIKESALALIPGVAHIDGTCRIQSVDADFDGKLHSLITYFDGLTGIPLVLNTSLNIRGEPIVETPSEALNCFLGSGIDVIYLGQYRVVKVETGSEAQFHQLVPMINDQFRLSRIRRSKAGGWSNETITTNSRTGYTFELIDAQVRILGHIDGKRSANEIYLDVGQGLAFGEFQACLTDLQRRGVLYFRRGQPS